VAIAVMQFMHHDSAVLTQIRSFLAVIEEGSLHRAAERLRMSQSALSRQMQALEHEVGGRLLERTSTGVKPTNGGHDLAAKMRAVLAAYDQAMMDTRRRIKGEGGRLRIGFLASAAREYLDPALKEVKRRYADARFKLLDLSPGEQVRALRAGEIDVGLTDESGEMLSREFYTRKLALMKSYIALPEDHALAGAKKLRLAQLKHETFVRGSEEEVPGLSRKLAKYCQVYGKFRPKFVGPAKNISESLEFVSNEGAVSMVPAFMRHLRAPGVVLIPLADPEVTWELVVVWQRGKTAGMLKTLLDALFASASAAPVK
jgi:DNA-binding transcriptional LysR family regulator